MKVMNFEDFWKEELKNLIMHTQDPEDIRVMHYLAEKAWKQALYTWNNAPR